MGFIADDIRAGSKLGPQARRKFYHVVYGKTVTMCALGAACAAIGDSHLWQKHNEIGLWRQWPELRAIVAWPEFLDADHRLLGEYMPDRDLMSMIIALNDTYMWTREAIADWIDTLDLPRPLEIPPLTLDLSTIMVDEVLTV